MKLAVLMISVAWLPVAANRPSRQRVEQATAAMPGSPEDVARRFSRLDADGAQLTRDGWLEIAAMFLQPGPWHRPTTINVVKDEFGASDALILGDGRATVRMGYIHLGFLDVDRAVFRTKAPSPLKLREDLYLTLVRPERGDGQGVWRIEGSVPDPLVTLTAATRYVTELRERTTDPKVRANADRTLAALKRQR